MSASRLRACLAAAVALAGAGLIAVNPVAPSSSVMGADFVHRGVRLTTSAADLAAATDPLTEWANVITGAVTNIEQIGGEIQADPLPVLAQVIANQLAFSETIDTNLQSLLSSVNTLVSDELPQAVQTLLSGIEAGDIGSAVNNFTSGLLLDLLPGATPLVNILDIPGEIAQNLANVVTSQVPNAGLEILLAPLGLLFGTTQALADDSQAIVDALQGGQYSTALTDLLNMPAIATGAFLNGYDATATYDIGYDGLLSSAESGLGSGLLDQLLVQIPQQIASTLADGSTPATLAGDLTALLAMF
jgi:hypothetical protein